jgi:hypothetical protein
LGYDVNQGGNVFRFSTGAKSYCLLKKFQTICETHPSSYSEGSDGPFLEIKWSNAEVTDIAFIKVKFTPL